MICPNCNFNNPDQFKFCGECGTRIVNIVPETKSSARKADLFETEISADAERRHITVLFCDLVGSTQLSEELDPEDFRQILRVYQDTCGYVVNKYSGHLAQYLGDGVLVYFGYPGAHADDSQRAVRCAIEIVSEMKNLVNFRQNQQDINLSVRIGIHTGLVVVGDTGGGKNHGHLALGNTPNIAARLQALAEPDTIMISPATYRLVRDYFECELMGAFSLKGVSHKLDIYRVERERKYPVSFKSDPQSELTPFVGRDNEVQKLVASWKNVRNKQGEVVLITGEPGIGKTRFLRVFEEQVKNDPHTWLVCRCISYYQNSAFYPIIKLIRNQLSFRSGDAVDQNLLSLEKALSDSGFDLNETIPVLSSILSLPIAGRYRSLDLTPQKIKERTIEILIEWLIRSAKQQPLLFVLEDLHWADHSTLEHLTQLMDKIDQQPIMIIITCHPRFTPPISPDSRLTRIELDRLTREDLAKMVTEIAGGKLLPSEVLDMLLTKTDGVPLFVEELTKMLLESRWLKETEKEYQLKSHLPDKVIPDTLQDALMARLDQLGAVKEVVQLAAIIGRDFSFDLMQELCSLPSGQLKKELKSLVDAEILNIQETAGETRYVFRQVMIQDAAYNSLLKTTRQKHHRKIAHIMENKFKDIATAHPQVLAYHYAKAEMYQRAIEYHLAAGRFLIGQSAHREAIGQLRKGLSLVEHISDARKKIQLELDLQILLGVPLIATRGYGAPEVGEVYERATTLSREVGDIPHLFPALVGQYRFYLLRGDIRKAFDISELLLSWSVTGKKVPLMIEANRAIGVALFHTGEVAVGLEHLEKSIQLYDPKKHGNHALIYGSDPEITCLSYGALAKCLLGQVNQAREFASLAIQKAKQMKHPFSLVLALNHSAWMCQFLGDTTATITHADELLSVSRKLGFPFWESAGTFFRGWAQAITENSTAGIDEMVRGTNAFLATGAGSVLPYFLTVIAETYLRFDQPDNARKWLDDAESSARKNDEHFFDADIYRVKAAIIRKSGKKSDAEAESMVWRSLETARRQKLRILELRALISLWDLKPRHKEIMKQLTDVFGGFTNEYDFEDLKKAKRILGQ